MAWGELAPGGRTGGLGVCLRVSQGRGVRRRTGRSRHRGSLSSCGLCEVFREERKEHCLGPKHCVSGLKSLA